MHYHRKRLRYHLEQWLYYEAELGRNPEDKRDEIDRLVNSAIRGAQKRIIRAAFKNGPSELDTKENRQAAYEALQRGDDLKDISPTVSLLENFMERTSREAK